MLDDFFYSGSELKRSFREFHSRKRAYAFSPDNRGEPTLMALIQNHEAIIGAAVKAIKAGESELGPGRAYTISADKDRIIYHFNWLDTFLLFHFARSLAEITDKIIPDSVFSYRKGKSSSAALAILKSYLRSNSAPVHVVRRDISSFGEQMVHSFLREDLERYAKPGRMLTRLFKQVCAFKRLEGGKLTQNSRGLPGGHYLQLVSENLYLLELDLKMELFKPGCYLRFGDDILFSSNDEELAARAAKTIDDHLQVRGVAANPAKSRNLHLVPPNRGKLTKPLSLGEFLPTTNFSHLGSQVFWSSELAIPSKKLMAFRIFMRTRINAACRAIPRDESSERRLAIAIRSVANLFSSRFHAHSEDSPLKMIFQEVHNERQLRELDRWLALLVLKVALSRGFKKGQFRRYAPSKLRQLGLPSLLHLRRTHGLR